MKDNELTQTQTDQEDKSPIAQNSDKAKRLLAQQAKAKAEAEAKAKATAKKPAVKKHESMENLALRLRKEKASEATILKNFTVAYKAKGITDNKFIKARTAIYLKIADNAIATSKPASKVSKAS